MIENDGESKFIDAKDTSNNHGGITVANPEFFAMSVARDLSATVFITPCVLTYWYCGAVGIKVLYGRFIAYVWDFQLFECDSRKSSGEPKITDFHGTAGLEFGPKRVAGQRQIGSDPLDANMLVHREDRLLRAGFIALRTLRGSAAFLLFVQKVRQDALFQVVDAEELRMARGWVSKARQPALRSRAQH